MSKDGDGVHLTPAGFTVHASEKVSTGDYENANYSMTIEGDVEGVEALGAEAREDLYQRLMDIQRDLQRHVEQAARNRTKIRDREDWEAFEV